MSRGEQYHRQYHSHLELPRNATVAAHLAGFRQSENSSARMRRKMTLSQSNLPTAPQSHIFFDGAIAEKRGQILQPFPMVTKRGTTMDTVLVGKDVSQDFLGVN